MDVIKMKTNVNSFLFILFHFCAMHANVPGRQQCGSIVKIWEEALMNQAACAELDGRKLEAHVLLRFSLFSIFNVVKSTETCFQLNPEQNACGAKCPSANHRWLFQLALRCCCCILHYISATILSNMEFPTIKISERTG